MTARATNGRALVLLGCLLAILAALGAVSPAVALESAPSSTPHGTATLISDTDAVTSGVPFHIALRLRLANGWHTYWRNPGEAGIPPELTLRLPPGAKAGPIQWPVPQRLREGDLVTYAFSGDVVLPVVVTTDASDSAVLHAGPTEVADTSPGPPRGAPAYPLRTDRADRRPMRIEAEANWLVCKDICVPEHASLTLSLADGPPAPSAQAPLFMQSREQQPVSVPWEATIAPDGRLWVRGAGLGPETVKRATFIPDRPGMIVDSAPQRLNTEPGGLVLSLRLQPRFHPGPGFSGLLQVEDRSGQRLVTLVNAAPGAIPDLGRDSVLQFLWLAFLGGLILNLMPCVFPVLAVKALSFAEGAKHGHAGRHAIAYSVGVLVAFTSLGAALMGLRAAGAAGGWGFQFQSPAFVAAMAWLLFGIGLNLSGVFQVGGRWSGAGDRLTRIGGLSGSFFTGLLAVVLATPCTAPFMGAAIAGAMTQPAPSGLLIFAAMGAGMAAPYAALACTPGLARLMPHPGPWMVRLRHALAIPMYASSAWLLWVMYREAGLRGMLGAVAGLVLIAITAWALGAGQRGSTPGRKLAQSIAAGAILTVAALLTALSGQGSSGPALAASGGDAFSEARLAALRQEGRPVFVDMTAAWCVTCLVNEEAAIERPAVQEAFASRNVAYLKGDWTRQDPAITAFLRRYRRDGVPLYVYFPPGNGAPVLLPQILTESVVLSALGRG